MPNLKIYVDETLYPGLHDRLQAALPPARALLCDALGVDVPACQLAVMPVIAMADLPPVNAEMMILPRADRSRARVTQVAQALQALLGDATGLHVAVRVAFLDPATYVALK